MPLRGRARNMGLGLHLLRSLHLAQELDAGLAHQKQLGISGGRMLTSAIRDLLLLANQVLFRIWAEPTRWASST